MKGWIFIVVILSTAAAVHACPTCKESVALTDAAGGSSAVASSLGAGFNWSIYFMLGGVIAVMGLVGRILIKAIRQE
jgi:hypothetical protein